MHRLIFLVLPFFVVLTFPAFVVTSPAREVTLLHPPHGAVRFSLGRLTTAGEIEQAAQVVAEQVRKIRSGDQPA